MSLDIAGDAEIDACLDGFGLLLWHLFKCGAQGTIDHLVDGAEAEPWCLDGNVLAHEACELRRRTDQSLRDGAMHNLKLACAAYRQRRHRLVGRGTHFDDPDATRATLRSSAMMCLISAAMSRIGATWPSPSTAPPEMPCAERNNWPS